MCYEDVASVTLHPSWQKIIEDHHLLPLFADNILMTFEFMQP